MNVEKCHKRKLDNLFIKFIPVGNIKHYNQRPRYINQRLRSRKKINFLNVLKMTSKDFSQNFISHKKILQPNGVI